MHSLSEQELLRRNKKEELEKLGINPYPSAAFIVNNSCVDILKGYDEEPSAYQSVVVAGRLMKRRIMGSASFVELQDASGKIQLYIQRDAICPGEDKSLYNTVFKKLIDTGDIVGIKGYVFKTKVGEITIHATALTLLAKSLKPLPMVKETNEGGEHKVYDAFTSPEHRYRQRYVDLIVNPHVRKIFEGRTKIVNLLRKHFDQLGCMEVETPILQPIYGGASAKPFKTHHNTLDIPLYLRIANELYLKRLIVGGFEGVYEFAKDFRNEGMSRFHNPEFTQLEAYVAYKDYHWMLNKIEVILEQVAVELHGNTKVKVGNSEIDFKGPWKRYTMFEVIQEYTGKNVEGLDEDELRQVAQTLKVSLDKEMGKGKIIDEIFGTCCEPHLIQPTFITDYPIEMSPLAKKKEDNPSLVERFELICNGKEVANCFSELNDPIDQQRRFEDQIALGKRGDEEAMVLDEDFLRALSYGMPPTVGIGIGIDRLCMMMLNAPSIQEVIFFPQMRPERNEQ